MKKRNAEAVAVAHELERQRNEVEAQHEVAKRQLDRINQINEEIKTAITSFYSTYKNNLKNYYEYIGNIKKAYKDTYLTISNNLVPWLKEPKNINLDQENSKVDELIKSMGEVVHSFNKFSE